MSASAEDGRLGVLAALGQLLRSVGVLLREIVYAGAAGAERAAQRSEGARRGSSPVSRAAAPVEEGPPQVWLDFVAEHDPGWLRERYPMAEPTPDPEAVPQTQRVRNEPPLARSVEPPSAKPTPQTSEQPSDKARHQQRRFRTARLVPLAPTLVEPTPTFAEPVEAPTLAEPTPTFAEPVEARPFVDPAPTFIEPAPTFIEPAPTFAEPVEARTFADPAPTFAEPAPTFAEPAPTFAEPAPTFAEPVEAREPRPFTRRQPSPAADSTGSANAGTRASTGSASGVVGSANVGAPAPHSPQPAIIEVIDRWPALPEPRPETEDLCVESSSPVAAIWRSLALGQPDHTIAQQRRK